MAVLSTDQIFGGEDSASAPAAPDPGYTVGPGGSGVDEGLAVPPLAAAPPPSPAAPPATGPAGGQVLSTDQIFGDAASAGKPTAQTGKPKLSGTLANIGAGTSDTVAETLGLPVDAVAWGMRKAGLPVGDAPVGGSASLKSAFGLVGADPRNVTADTTGDKIARAAGSGLASMVVPGIGAETALAKTALGAPTAVPSLARAGADLLASGATPGAAIAGATGAATGNAAATMVPEPYKPVAELAGNIVGGGMVPLTAAAGSKMLGVVTDGAERLAAPFRGTPAAEKAATLALIPKLGDAGVSGTVDTIEHDGAPLVAGSDPTLAAVTQTPGVAQLQIARQDLNGPAYLDRKDAQAEAQQAAIEGTAPADANADSLPAALDQQRADRIAKGDTSVAMAQDLGDQAVSDAKAAQDQRVTGLADQQATNADTTAAATAADAERARQQADAQAAAAAQARDDALSSTGVTDASPGDLGAQQRAELQSARTAQSVPASAKFNAVDPDGKLALEIPAARDQVQKTIADMGEADAISPEEGRIYGIIQRTPVKKYKDVQSIDAALGNAIRAARANPLEANSARRMGDVQSALRGDVTSATGLSEADIEAELAARSNVQNPPRKNMGAVTPPAAESAGDVALHSAGQEPGEGQNRAVVNLGPENGSASRGTGGEGRSGPAAVDAGKPDDLGEILGEGGAPPRGPDGAAPGSGASGDGAAADGAAGQEALTPHFPPEALGRWLDAKAAWRDMKETFDRGPVGQVLAKGMQGQPYKLTDSSVMDAFWRGSGARPEDVKALVNALGGSADKLQAALGYVANDLRKSAVKPGTNDLNETAYARWLDKHGPALKVLDGLSDSPQLRQRFESFAGAQRTLNDTRAAGDAAVKETVAAGADRMKTLTAAQKQEMGTAKTEEAAKVRAVEGQAKADNRDMAVEHQQAMSEWQKSYAGQFLDERDPQQAMQKILKSGIGSPAKLTEAMAELSKRTAFDKDARAGLQKMVADEISRSLTDANGWIKPDTFRKFVTNNEVGLRKVFSPEQLRNLDDVAADLERNSNVDRLAKINVGPTTGARIGAQKEAGGHGAGGNSVLGYFLGEHLGDALGEHLGLVGKLLGQVAGVAGQAVVGHKVAAFDHAKGEVLDKMLLDPEFAKTMLMKYRPETDPMIAKRLGSQLRRVGLASAINAGGQS